MAVHSSHFQGLYFLYLSVKFAHFGWYVGLQKNGKAKKGSKTVYPPHQKAIEFVTKKQAIFYNIPPGPDVLPIEENGDVATRKDAENLTLLPSNLKFIDDDDETKLTNNKILYDLTKENPNN